MNKPYLKTHPLAFCFGASSAIAGLLTVLFPEVRAQSLTLAVLPEYIAYVLGFLNLLGGVACAYGIWHSKPRYEAAGFSALTATQIAAVVNSIAALGFWPSILGILLRGGLGLGCALRAASLVSEEA